MSRMPSSLIPPNITVEGKLNEKVFLFNYDTYNFHYIYGDFYSGSSGNIYNDNGSIYVRVTKLYDGNSEASGAIEFNTMPDSSGYTLYNHFVVNIIPHRYKPTTKEELIRLINDESINLTDIDTSLITDMSELFKDSTISSYRLQGVNSWITENVTNFQSMFENCINLNCNLSFNLKSARNTSRMFYGCSNLYGNSINITNTDNIVDASFMFYGCSNITFGDLSTLFTFNLSSLINAESMFEGCSSITILRLGGAYKIENAKCLFKNCSSLKWNQEYWYNEFGSIINAESMFEGCSSIDGDFFSNKNWTTVTNSKAMFKDCIRLRGQPINIPNSTDMSFMFYNNQNCIDYTVLYYLNVGNHTPKTFESMFENCINLEGQDASLQLVNCISTKNMFKNCQKFSKNVSISSTPTNPCTMEGMFEGCTKLGSGYYINFNGFKLNNVTNINRIFKGCRSIGTFNFSTDNDTSSIESMEEAFSGCTNLNVRYDNWNVTNVTNMTNAFEGVTENRIPWWYNIPNLEFITYQNKTVNYSSIFTKYTDFTSFSIDTTGLQNINVTKQSDTEYIIRLTQEGEIKPVLNFLNGKAKATYTSLSINIDKTIEIKASSNQTINIVDLYGEYNDLVNIHNNSLQATTQTISVSSIGDDLYNVIANRSGTYRLSLNLDGLPGIITVNANKLIEDIDLVVYNNKQSILNLNEMYPDGILDNIIINNTYGTLEIIKDNRAIFNILSKGVYTYTVEINLNGDISNLNIDSRKSLSSLNYTYTATKPKLVNLKNEFGILNFQDIVITSNDSNLLVNKLNDLEYNIIGLISGIFTANIQLNNETEIIHFTSTKLISNERRNIKSNTNYSFDYSDIFPDSVFNTIEMTCDNNDLVITSSSKGNFNLIAKNTGIFNCVISVNGENSSLIINVSKLIQDNIEMIYNKTYTINFNQLYPEGVFDDIELVETSGNDKKLSIKKVGLSKFDITFYYKGSYTVEVRVGKIVSTYIFKVFFADLTNKDVYQYPTTFIDDIIKPILYDDNLYIYQYNQYGEINWVNKYFEYINNKMKKYYSYIYLWYTLKTNQDLSNLDMLFINNNETYFYINFIEKYFTGINKAFGSSSASVFWDGENNWNENGVIWDKVLNISNLSVNKFKSILRFINDINYNSFNIIRFTQFCKEFINADNEEGDEYIDVFVDDTSFENPNNILLYVSKNTENTVLLDSILRSVYKQLMPMYDFRLNSKVN